VAFTAPLVKFPAPLGRNADILAATKEICAEDCFAGQSAPDLLGFRSEIL